MVKLHKIRTFSDDLFERGLLKVPFHENFDVNMNP